MSCYAFVFAGFLLLNGGAMAQTSNFETPLPSQGSFLQNIPYGPNQLELLDVCRPDSSAGLHPGIIMIHGGGWAHGDKRKMDDWCQRFAQAGYVVADIDYRLANTRGSTPNWPNFQIADTQLAIRWMRTHAKELDLDPTRLCAYGTSAGGYLAVFAATLTKILPGDVASIAPNIPVTLSCVADGFGPVDFTNPHFLKKALVRLIGYSYAQNPALYHNDSPLFYVNSHTPPMIIVHGTEDTLVPIAQSEALEEALKRDGVPVEFITYQGNHNYEGLDENELNDVLQKIMAFLKIRIRG